MRRENQLHIRSSVGILILLSAALLSFADQLSGATVTVRTASSRGEAQVALVDLAAEFGARYGVYAAIREHAPGAHIFIDSSLRGSSDQAQAAGVSRSYLLALGGAAVASPADLSMVDVPIESPVRSGAFRDRAWALYVKNHEEPASVLLAAPVGGVLRIVDARLVPEWSTSEQIVAPELRRAQPPIFGALIDGGILLLLILSGGLVTPRSIVVGPVRAALAFPVGLAALGALGVFRVPGAWALFATVLVTAGGWAWLRRNGVTSGWSWVDLPVLALAAAGSALVAMWGRSRGFIWTSPDSINYLSGGRLLADGQWTVNLVSLKRGMAQQQLHAPGFALGVEGFQSMGAAVLVVSVLLVALLPLLTERAPVGSVPQRGLWVAGGSAVLLLAAPAVPIQAAYINSHVLLALLLLALAVLLGLSSEADSISSVGIVPAAGLLLTAVVLLRPEGTLLGALVLLGTLRAVTPAQPALWRWLGAATIAWNGVLAHGHFERGQSPARIVLAMLAVGVGLMLAPNVLRLLTPRQVRAAPLLVGSVLWAVTLVLLLVDIGNIRFLDAAIVNIGEAQGRWGSFGLILFLLGVVAVALPERASDGPGLLGARWALIGFIPLSLLSKLGDGLQRPDSELGILLSGGGRVGWGDSVNRMWTHAIFLVLLLVIVRLTQGRAADQSRDDDQVGASQEQEA